MKILIRLSLISLLIVFGWSNVQAQMQPMSIIDMEIDKLEGDTCFYVNATTDSPVSEIEIFTVRNGETTSISAVDTDRCTGTICFDAPKGPFPVSLATIYCAASAGSVTFRDGCVIVIGPD